MAIVLRARRVPRAINPGLQLLGMLRRVSSQHAFAINYGASAVSPFKKWVASFKHACAIRNPCQPHNHLPFLKIST
eukprot:5019337-Pyramimonas_sp.AAC.1